jgi:hypothetical protein
MSKLFFEGALSTSIDLCVVETEAASAAVCAICMLSVLKGCTIIATKREGGYWVHYCRGCVEEYGTETRAIDGWIRIYKLLSNYPCNPTNSCNVVHITQQLASESK